MKIVAGAFGLMQDLAAVLAAILLFGCSTIGDDFDLDHAQLIRNGMTREQVIDLMGSPPSEVEGGDHGKLIWLYSSADPLSVHLKRLSFSFDDQGKLYGLPKAGAIGSIDEDDY